MRKMTRKQNRRQTRTVAAVAAVMLAAAALAGCGKSEPAATEAATEAATAEADKAELEKLNGKIMGWMNTGFDMTPDIVYEMNGIRPSEILFFPTENEAIAALKSGRTEMSIMPYEAAAFITREDPDLRVIRADGAPHHMFMLARGEDKELIEQLNGAIGKLNEDGTLEELFRRLVVELDPENLANAGTVPEISGADTVYVGISGDMMPLDYIGSDGKPAGYNVELMTKISEIIQKNVEFVSIPTDAKFQGLLSGRIDVFFWHGMSIESDEVTATNPYVTFSGFGVLIKK